MLLASLQRQTIGVTAIRIPGHADQAAGQLPGMLGVHRQVAGVRTAESHWHPEPLGGAERDVGADLAGRGDQCQRQQIGTDGDQCAAVVGLRGQRGPIRDPAAGPGQLGDDAEEPTVRQAIPQIGGDDLDAQRLGAGGHHRRGLREHVGIDGQPVRRAAGRTMHQGHGLGRRGALVEH